MQCPKCQEINKPNAKFCKRCGSAMNGDAHGRSFIKLFVFIIVGLAVLLILGAMLLVGSHRIAKTPVAPVNPAVQIQPQQRTRLGIAYGTEKEAWLTAAVKDYSATPEGRSVQIDLKPMGSIEAANAILRKDTSIQVWSPASALYKSVFVRDWGSANNGTNPILTEDQLVQTPMVFVMWQERYDAFLKSYSELNFRTIGQAMNAPGGWSAIANRPEWMFFKFSHTNPNQSNSGLMSLVLMGYDQRIKKDNLNATDITSTEFQSWLMSIERNLVGSASGLVSSTGYLMTSMLQRGYSSYDCILVYEATAIERMQQAADRWGTLRIVYPPYNMWNDNPYYVLDVPWNSPAQRQAASDFRQFLLSPAVQESAIEHGFRPVRVVPGANSADTPWTRFQATGLKWSVPGTFCEPPSADVIENLLLAWQRSQNGK